MQCVTYTAYHLPLKKIEPAVIWSFSTPFNHIIMFIAAISEPSVYVTFRQCFLVL